MGAFESADSYDTPLPVPPSSAVYVVRNGRYEAQNLMPVQPRADMLDFDGFVVRRGTGRGYNGRPPEMKQASLAKSAVSIRRDSARAMCVEGEDNHFVISFIFDAIKPATLALHLMVMENETPLEEDDGSEDGKTKIKKPSSMELISREAARGEEDNHVDNSPAAPAALDCRRIGVGLGQVYQSPPLDLAKWPLSQLAFDPSRPKDVPIAAQLEADVESGELPSIQYTYISLQSSAQGGDDTNKAPQLSANIYKQKLQYGEQCFVLHEVFGVASKMNHDTDVEGNSDCVICLSEPRDTAVLPCRHMCFCSYCAGIVRIQCDRCPVCRQKVQSLLQFKRDEDPQIADDPLAGPNCNDISSKGRTGGSAPNLVTAPSGSEQSSVVVGSTDSSCIPAVVTTAVS